MGTKILFIDDSKTMRHAGEIAMDFNENQFITAVTGDEGVEKAIIEQPDIIFVDLTLPDHTGYEVCKMLKTKPETLKIPLILMTNPFDSYDEKKGEQVGVDINIPKPFDTQKLRDLLSDTLPTIVVKTPEDLEPTSVGITPLNTFNDENISKVPEVKTVSNLGNESENNDFLNDFIAEEEKHDVSESPVIKPVAPSYEKQMEQPLITESEFDVDVDQSFSDNSAEISLDSVESVLAESSGAITPDDEIKPFNSDFDEMSSIPDVSDIAVKTATSSDNQFSEDTPPENALKPVEITSVDQLLENEFDEEDSDDSSSPSVEEESFGGAIDMNAVNDLLEETGLLNDELNRADDVTIESSPETVEENVEDEFIDSIPSVDNLMHSEFSNIDDDEKTVDASNLLTDEFIDELEDSLVEETLVEETPIKEVPEPTTPQASINPAAPKEEPISVHSVDELLSEPQPEPPVIKEPIEPPHTVDSEEKITVKLDDQQMKQVITEIVKRVSRELIEDIVWQVVPDLAESIIKEELRKILDQ